jgi:O-antigen/teichoic acid export membrane protein
VARSTVHNLLGVGLPLLVALATIPYLANRMGSEAFGLLGIAWLLLSYAGELGFGRATTRFVAEALEERQGMSLSEIVWTNVVLQTALALIAGALLWIFAPALSERVLKIPPALVAEARSTFRLLGVGMPVVLLAAAFRGVLEASQRFDLVNRIRIPVVSATYALPVLALWLGWSLPGIVALLLGARLTSVVGYFVLAGRLHPILLRPSVAGKVAAARLLRFGGWVMVSSVVSPLLVYLDRFLLGAVMGMTAVAFYTAPYELVARTLLIPAALAGALFPAFGALSARTAHSSGLAHTPRSARTARSGVSAGVEMRRIFARSVGFVFFIVGAVAVVLILLSDWIVAVWLGGDFGAQSALALKILAVGVVFNAIAHVPLTYLQGIERADLTGMFHLVELPIHAGVAWWLISDYGVAGAASAWTLRVALDALLLFVASGRLGMAGWWRPSGWLRRQA